MGGLGAKIPSSEGVPVSNNAPLPFFTAALEASSKGLLVNRFSAWP